MTPSHRAVLTCVALAVGVGAGCKRETPLPTVVATVPLVDGTGTYARAVETRSPDAQRYFDQGLRFLYGFNHDEAIRSFKQAQAFDPQCTMCFVGEALANGPHINNPELDDAHRAAGLAAARAANRVWHELHREVEPAGAHPAAEAERMGIELTLASVLVSRYASVDDKTPQSSRNEVYALAMRGLSDQSPNDADVAALAAEAFLDLRPWDQWTPDGKMQPGTDDAIRLVDRALALVPLHPFANHLAIHIWESSPTPEKADVAAERVRAMAPALGHLVHMATHIDVRRGRWAEAIASSHKALTADAAYLAQPGAAPPGFYRFYVAHNEHMLAYAAMNTGQKALALAAIDRMVKDIPAEWLANNAQIADGIVALPLEVKMRFGMWDEILAAPDFDASLPIARALRHAARVVAFAAKDDTKSASQALADLENAEVSLPADARFGNNDGHAVLLVARELALGEMLLALSRLEKNTALRTELFDRGLHELAEAAHAEDALRYDEPPDWLQPARHALGAALLNRGRAHDAELVYREDLADVPRNGWALLGLAQALEAQKLDATSARAELAVVWHDADVTPETSCLCQKKRTP